jgi:radical SAM superfamily enzyme YgiQ (UPF0313 family)
VGVLLLSTYDLGRQPMGLASPAAWLRAAEIETDCVDLSRDALSDDRIRAADLVAFYLPMHTATRLAGPVMARVRGVNPSARLVAYGLYAPLNAAWLREQGVEHVLGPEAEADLVALARSREPEAGSPAPRTRRLRLLQPDRSALAPLTRYTSLQMPDGSRRVVGATEATRGCKHVCRHCPIVPVYEGTFRAIPLDLVIEDVRAQVRAGAQHISFGDPDFLNGPTHARRLVERVAREFPRLTYDVTIKIEHLLDHAGMLGVLRDTGCLFVTSAVESVDDEVLVKLRKGHTRAGFVRAVDLCGQAGLTLSPTFVPFTPWTTREGYLDLLEQIALLGLVRHVAPIQLAIRLLVTARSKLLELPDIERVVEPFDATSLTFPWRNPDPAVDRLQQGVLHLVSTFAKAPRGEVFARIEALARGSDPLHESTQSLDTGREGGLTPPYLTEAWYCCAEPGPEQVDLM